MENEVTVTVSLNLKPDAADSFCDIILPELQRQTRAFDGVKSARAVRQANQPTRVLFIDIFASQEAADAYFSWRKSNGDLDLLGSLLSEPPSIEVWPLMAGSMG